MGCYLLTYPFTACGHVQKQTMVLPARHLHQVLRAVFCHHMGFRQLTGHDACFHLAARLAGLERPDQRLVRGGNLLPALFKCQSYHLKLRFIHGSKTGQQQHGWERIQHDLFAARMASTTPMKDTLGICGKRHLGNGV